MILLGLTGDIAAGKSTVAQLLAARGAFVIDADKLVHELYADRTFSSRVAALFEGQFLDLNSGQVVSLLNPQGVIDRAALSALVFRDPRAMRRLEAVVHPAVAELRARKLEELRARETEDDSRPVVAVLEAVKLIESGQHEGCDIVWWVHASPETQLRRLVENRQMNEAAAKARLASQPDAEPKRRLLGDIPLIELHNDGSLAELEAAVEREWGRLAQISKN